MDFPDFAVASGEEASDPLVLHGGEVVRVDELAGERAPRPARGDLADVAGLGVDVWRYGMPWRLTEPEPGIYDWTLWDRALAACDRAGLSRSSTCATSGCPTTTPASATRRGSRASAATSTPSSPATREPTWFTPVNEPGITALFSAPVRHVERPAGVGRRLLRRARQRRPRQPRGAGADPRRPRRLVDRRRGLRLRARRRRRRGGRRRRPTETATAAGGVGPAPRRRAPRGAQRACTT